METVLSKIQIGSVVFTNGRLYTITAQLDDRTFVWVDNLQPLATGSFQFTDDQTEDSGFVIIG